MKKFFGISFSLIFLVLSIDTALVFAGSITWSCPVCPETFRFDPRDTAYRNSFAQQHLATHQSAGQSGGYSSSGQVEDIFLATAMPVLESIFQSIGQDIADTLFGPDPEQQRRIEEERARLEAQRQAAIEEEARRKRERHKKLIASLKFLPGVGELSLKGLEGKDASLSLKGLSESSSLSLKGLPESSSVSSNAALDNLRRAAYLMQQSLRSDSNTEAAFLADEAFRVADGEKLYLDVPEIGPASAVTQEDANDYLKLQRQINAGRKEYIQVSDKLALKHHQYKVIKKAKVYAKEQVEQQEEKLKAIPTDASDQEKAVEENKLAEARKLLEEATKFETLAKENLQKVQNEADQINKDLAHKKQEQQKFITDLAKE